MPIEMDGETYLSTTEASERLGVSRVTIHNHVKQGRLHRYRRGLKRASFYKQSEVETLRSRLSEMRENKQ